MEISAKTRFVRITPRKLRLIADMIRGESVAKAITTLKFTNKRGAKLLYKTLMSAVANAEHRGTVNVDSLFVKKVLVDGAPMLKRFLPRAMGRATMVRKRMSHLNIVLDER